jgi:hypothetical protein
METDAKTGAMKGVSLDRYDLIPPKALEYLALIYGKGSLKYADRNWEKGYKWGLSFRALMKHAWAAWRGEWLDPESGLPHLMHAAWHCFTIVTYHDYRLGTDDRTELRESPVEPGPKIIPRATPQDTAREGAFLPRWGNP